MAKRKIPVFETDMNRRLREMVEHLQQMTLPERLQSYVDGGLMTQEEADQGVAYWKAHGGGKNGKGRRPGAAR